MIFNSVEQPTVIFQENSPEQRDTTENPATDTINHVHSFPDTACIRTRYSGITFADTGNVITKIDPSISDRFPFIFTDKNRIGNQETKRILVGHLRDGKMMPPDLMHDDWIIMVLLSAALCYAVIRTISGNLFSELRRFFLVYGFNDPDSRDISGLFHWESTIINLASFINIALFGYLAAIQYSIFPDNLSGITAWLAVLVLIIVATTLRHIICLITGFMSDERVAFNEYLKVIYQWFRIIGIISFALVILISYTSVLSEGLLFTAGFITLGVIYLLRIFRLSLIFIKRSISIFYLILYLCALEFLPVLMSLKYFTGLA